MLYELVPGRVEECLAELLPLGSADVLWRDRDTSDHDEGGLPWKNWSNSGESALEA